MFSTFRVVLLFDFFDVLQHLTVLLNSTVICQNGYVFFFPLMKLFLVQFFSPNISVFGFQLYLSTQDMSKVTGMAQMFQSAGQFVGPANLNWNTAKVKTMEGMFEGATRFNSNIMNWVRIYIICFLDFTI